MKKAFVVAAALALALVGCAGGNSQSEDTSKKDTEAVEQTADDQATEEKADEGPTIEWTEVAMPEEAAKGAGFDKFGVVEKFNLGDLEYADPKFSYSDDVAQATWETPATMVYLRKGVDTYSVPLSDRKLDEFPARWNKVYEGTDVTCYGQAKGAVTVATWTDGVKSYGLTYQGLGGEEMSMDTDELHALVRGINEANADQDAKAKEEEKKKAEEEKKKAEEQKKAEEEKKKQEQEQQKKNALLSAEEAEKKAEEACGGDCTSIDRVSTNQYGDCWYAIAVDSSGTTYYYYVNNDAAYLIDKKEAPKQQQQQQNNQNQSEQNKDEHYEGEPVTIYGSVYAQWHKANDGQWYATFITYNNTQIFAQTAPAGGGWVFYALDGGSMVQVIYSDQESSDSGQYGPMGVSSHWQALDGGKWY